MRREKEEKKAPKWISHTGKNVIWNWMSERTSVRKHVLLSTLHYYICTIHLHFMANKWMATILHTVLTHIISVCLSHYVNFSSFLFATVHLTTIVINPTIWICHVCVAPLGAVSVVPPPPLHTHPFSKTIWFPKRFAIHYIKNVHQLLKIDI